MERLIEFIKDMYKMIAFLINPFGIFTRDEDSDEESKDESKDETGSKE